MRAVLVAILCASGLGLASTTAFAQLGIEIGPGGVQVGPTRRGPTYYEERPVVRDPRYERMARRCRFMVRDGEYDSWRECMDDNGF
jgi:hypothetical protein